MSIVCVRGRRKRDHRRDMMRPTLNGTKDTDI